MRTFRIVKSGRIVKSARIVTCAMPGAGAALPATAAMAQPGSRPLRYGLNGADFDGCTPYSEIGGLNPSGDNFLSVRAAPSARARGLDRLGPGRRVRICEGESVRGWTGIVYGPRGSTGCKVERPIPRPRPCRGPCRSGRVASRYVTPIAA
jgi:hypothetical protein